MLPPMARISSQLRRAPTRYRPISRIAVGGMAEVWRADAIFEDGTSHQVAIKRVLPQIGDDLFRAMFEDEARLGMLLRHRNIVRVYDARNVGNTYIMVMELVDGDSLKGLVERAHKRNARFPIPAALHITRELAKALAYVHTAVDKEGNHLGIIHRDVSPHNILLGRNGEVKLTDFGLADAEVHAHQRDENQVGGKIGYLAPEVIRRSEPDHRIDLFAVGIVLWEMLAGRRLFRGKDDAETVRLVARCVVPEIRKVNPNVPRGVAAVLDKLLVPFPDSRFGSGHALVDALDEQIEAIDREVGARDVSLLVGLHLAQVRKEKPAEERPFAVAELLAQELSAFADQAQGDMFGGDAPLDPSDFDFGIRSGVRPRPTEDD